MQSPLRGVRLSHNMTLSDVATAVGVVPSTLSRIERGTYKAPTDLAARLSAHFNNEIDELQILYPERYSISYERKIRIIPLEQESCNHGVEGTNCG